MEPDLRPSDVFTPNQFPLEEHNVYAARAVAERALKRSVGRAEIPVVYGEFGVGKTTLIKRFFLSEDRAGRLVHILTPAGKNMDDVARIVLEQLNYSVEVGGEARSRQGAEVSVEGGGSFIPLKARFRGSTDRETVKRTELLVTTPTDQGLLNVMADGRLTLVIDEMHKASDGFRLQLAELIKSASNLGRGYPRVVVLGTTSDASELVERDEGIDRLISEIRVEPMTDEEAEYVVRDGMLKLGLPIGDGLVNRIVRTAAGAPALLQVICLDVAEKVVQDGRNDVRDSDIEHAIRIFLLSGRARLTRKYMTAIETIGPKRYRKQILRAMAETEGDYVTMDQLIDRVSKQLEEEVQSTALSGPLRELKQAHYGEILMDVERPKELEGRVYNLTAFKDPRMKAFIRAMHAVEEQGLLPSEEDVDALPSDDDDDDEGF
jgi:RecA/RadA recombinase